MAGMKNPGHFEKINFDSLIRNGIVVVICILGIGVSIWFIRHDLNVNLQEPGRNPVGKAGWVTNNVKRISSGHFQWERLERYSPIYEGDVVSTDVFSQLKIDFEGGEKLELSPSSSVRIFYKDVNAIRFVAREGEMRIRTNQKALTVSLAEIAPVETIITDLRINLPPQAIAAIKVPENISSGEYILKLFQGSCTVISRGSSRTIEAGDAIKMGRDGTIHEGPPVIMLAPGNGARLPKTTLGSIPVEFHWKQFNAADGGITLEIAQSSDFAVQDGKFSSKTFFPAEGLSIDEQPNGFILPDYQSTVVELSEGTYYWRIYASSFIGDASAQGEADSGRLDIIYSQGARALSPAGGATVAFPYGKREVRFFWQIPEEVDSVMLEVANNPEMARPKIQKLINRVARGMGSFDSSDLDTGQWYWRVFPVVSGRTGPPSGIAAFSLEESADLSVQKPVSDSPAGNDPYIIFPPDNYTLEANRTPDVLFSWSNTFPNNARFQVSPLSDFSGTLIYDYEVSGFNMRSPFLAPGTYYWRIAGTDSGSSSHPNRLVVVPALPCPVLDSPHEDERLIIQDGVAVKFSWNQVNYANYYQFNLFLEGRELPLRGISSLHNDSIYVYFDPNTQGRFSWTIQGFTSPTETATGRIGLIARGRFFIMPENPSMEMNQIAWTIPRIANMQAYAGEVDSPITLISPGQGFNLPGLLALRSPPEARWVSDERLSNIQLIVSRTTDPSSDPRSIVKNVSETSVTFPSLSEGVWYWIIRGDTPELRGATPGDPFWLNVLPIPLLPVPRPIQPVSKAIIGLEQLTRDRSITFQWNNVEGANAYIFSLYQDDTTPKLIFTASPQASSSYIFDNLSLLNNGDYFWQIEAVYQDRNNVIEQRGRTSQYPFAINIQNSGNLRTTPQGTMYGQ